MKRYMLTDVVEIRLIPVHSGRWSHYRCQHVMADGHAQEAPEVNTKQQARQRQRDFFPNAAVRLTDGVLDFGEDTA